MSDTARDERQFPDHVDAREAGVIRNSLDILFREPCMRAIVRLFISRQAQGQPIEPLMVALLNEVRAFLKRDSAV